jgi:hypothetical protein
LLLIEPFFMAGTLLDSGCRELYLRDPGSTSETMENIQPVIPELIPQFSVPMGKAPN